MSAPFSITKCTNLQRPDALRVLHAGLSVEQQLGLVQALQLTREQDDTAFDGLLIAVCRDEILCATWCQLAPGRTAVMWLPDSDSPAAVELMKAAAAFLDEQQIVLAQFLAENDPAIATELLDAADFGKLARLAYLSVGCERFPATQKPSRLQFEGQASTQPQRLGELILQTYQQSLDCPQLNGVRTLDDVLDGYQQQGIFSPERWYFVRQQQKDVGVLILTEHPETRNWELVYMGLIPSVRGQGFGREVLDFAMWRAKAGNAQRLVLAVDEENQPAVESYKQAGFEPWDYRTVFARLRPQA